MTERSPQLPGLFLWTLLLLLSGTIGYFFSPPPESPLPDHTLREVQNRFGLPPDLIRAVILVESGGRPTVRSNRGAVGLMQILPSTGKELARMLNLPTPPNLEDPDINIQLGSFYLARLLVRYQGDLRLALAAYNAGPATLDKILNKHPNRDSQDLIDEFAPKETRSYVRKVLGFRKSLGTKKP